MGKTNKITDFLIVKLLCFILCFAVIFVFSFVVFQHLRCSCYICCTCSACFSPPLFVCLFVCLFFFSTSGSFFICSSFFAFSFFYPSLVRFLYFSSLLLLSHPLLLISFAFAFAVALIFVTVSCCFIFRFYCFSFKLSVLTFVSLCFECVALCYSVLSSCLLLLLLLLLLCCAALFWVGLGWDPLGCIRLCQSPFVVSSRVMSSCLVLHRVAVLHHLVHRFPDVPLY